MMTGIMFFVLSFYAGYLFFLYLSHPHKKKNKLPKIRIGNVEIMPNIKIHVGNKTYHLHHWFNLLLVIIASLFLYENYQHIVLLRGVAMGGIVQGLRYPDRFKFRLPRR